MQTYRTIRLIISLVLIALGMSAQGQTINFVMNSHPSPYLSDWQQHRETPIVVITNTTGKSINAKISCQLYDGKGEMIAETDLGKMPVIACEPGSSQFYAEDIFPPQDVKYRGHFDQKAAAMTGRIPDDNYRICVQLVNPTTLAALTTQQPQCSNFSIIAYEPPSLISPRNGEPCVASQTRRPQFEWTPLQPAYTGGIVTYRLQVMEVLPGQEPGQAYRTNRPILEKDFKSRVTASWPVDYALPDTGMSYVWSVTALDDQDRPLGSNEGRSGYFTFNCVANLNLITPPQVNLLTPADNATITADDLNKPNAFSWTSTQTPMAGGLVTYRMTIYKGNKGEEPTLIPHHGKPILTHDYKSITTTSWPTKLGTPDTGAQYVWEVQAVDDQDRPLGSNEGRSGYFAFSVGQPGDNTGVTLLKPSDNATVTADELNKPNAFSWTPVQPAKSGETVTYRMTIYRGDKGDAPAQIRIRQKPMLQKDYKSINNAPWHPTLGTPDTSAQYVWGIQALDENMMPLGDNEGRTEWSSFSVVQPENNTGVTLLTPTDNATVTAEELNKQNAFSWTPVQPSVKGGNVNYQLKIYEVDEGSQPNANKRYIPRRKPIFEAISRNTTGTSLPENGNLETGKTYVWQLQALDDQDRPIGENEGRSGYFAFSVGQPGDNKGVTLLTPADNATVTTEELNKQNAFSWTPVQPSVKGDNVNYQLKIYEVEEGSQPNANKRYIPRRKPIFEAISRNTTGTSLPENGNLETGKTYVWQLQALDDQDRPLGSNEGRSGYFTFSTGPISFTLAMNSYPSPYLSDWQQHRETASLVINNNTGKSFNARISSQLYDSKGAMVAETDLGKMPVIVCGPGSNQFYAEDLFPPQDVKYHGAKAATMTGRIPDDNYRLSVQLVNPTNLTALTTQQPQYGNFTITANQPPTLISPRNGEPCVVSQTSRPVFQWTPVQPSVTGGSVTYRLTIKEVSKGQTPEQAYRTNRPMMEKDYKNAASATLPNDIKLDTGSTYVWSVQALDDQDRPLGANEGRSGYFAFSTGPISFNLAMNSYPSPYLSDWQQHRETASLVINNNTGKSFNARISSQLYDSKGELVAETDLGKMPVIVCGPGSNQFYAEDIFPPMDVKYHGTKAATMTGRIPDDNYRLSVQLVNPTTLTALTTQQPQYGNFTITAIQPPSLISPRNGEPCVVSQTRRPVFQWTPVQPSVTGGSVTYRLTIKEVGKGQTPEQAYRTNRPMMEKDFKNAASATLPNDIKLDTGNTYVWSVQALDDQDRPLGANEGRSGYFAFSTGPISFTLVMNSYPPPYLSDWQQHRETASLVINNNTGKSFNARISSQLYDSKGVMVAETDLGKMPVIVCGPGSNQFYTEDILPPQDVKYHGYFDTKAVGATGRMHDDNYRLSVQLVNPTTLTALTTQQPQYGNFTITANQPPALISPRNGEPCVVSQTRRPVFQWTPVQPSVTGGSVTYRLTIKEVGKGQTPELAYRTNHPMMEKDYKNAASATLPNDIKLDTGSTYVWEVQALDDQDRPLGANEGRSGYSVFNVFEKNDPNTGNDNQRRAVPQKEKYRRAVPQKEKYRRAVPQKEKYRRAVPQKEKYRRAVPQYEKYK